MRWDTEKRVYLRMVVLSTVNDCALAKGAKTAAAARAATRRLGAIVRLVMVEERKGRSKMGRGGEEEYRRSRGKKRMPRTQPTLLGESKGNRRTKE
jgi:hypothetical protein